MPDQWRGFCQPLSLCVTTRRLYRRTSDSEATGILQVLQHSPKAAQSLIGLLLVFMLSALQEKNEFFQKEEHIIQIIYKIFIYKV